MLLFPAESTDGGVALRSFFRLPEKPSLPDFGVFSQFFGDILKKAVYFFVKSANRQNRLWQV